MPQLKPSFILTIKNALDDSVFTKNDFNLSFPDSGQVLVKIEFLYNPDYSLLLSEEERRENVVKKSQIDFKSETRTVVHRGYVVNVSPGSYKSIEREELYKIGEFPEHISDWCLNIASDVEALAVKPDPLQDLRNKFQGGIEANLHNLESDFEDHEISQMSQKFDDLLAEVNRLKDQFSLSQKHIDQLEKQLDEFKQSTVLYPKGVWAKITANKLSQTIGKLFNTPEGRKLIFDQMRKLIAGGDV